MPYEWVQRYAVKNTDKNKLGLTLGDYVNAQILACSELDVPVFDAYPHRLL